VKNLKVDLLYQIKSVQLNQLKNYKALLANKAQASERTKLQVPETYCVAQTTIVNPLGVLIDYCLLIFI
jgi:hypothetical protein